MAKTRAQRKAERRRKQQQQAQRPEGTPGPTGSDSEAQHETQVPESAGAIEAKLAEQGADLEALKESPEQADADAEAAKAPAPSRADVGQPEEAEDKISRRARKREERERRERAKESARRREAKEEPVERRRGAVIGFLASCVAELKRVQWPDREALIQGSAVTLVFIALLAVYLGVLDTAFNWFVQRIL